MAINTMSTAQDYHDKVTEFIDEYYNADKDAKPAPNERIANADSLVEHYVEQYDKRPPASVLSRLATYILLDVLSDPHPDKMSRDEYPIASYRQIGRTFKRHNTVADVQFGDARDVGRRKVNASMLAEDGDSDDYNTSVSSLHLVEQLRTVEDDIVDKLSFNNVLDSVNLTGNEREVLRQVFEHNRYQGEIAEQLNISQARVSQLYGSGFDKVREHIVNNSDIYVE